MRAAAALLLVASAAAPDAGDSVPGGVQPFLGLVALGGRHGGRRVLRVRHEQCRAAIRTFDMEPGLIRLNVEMIAAVAFHLDAHGLSFP